MPLRVVLADDERPARRFLAGVLETIDDCDVVGEASTGAETLEQIETLSPDLVLLDINMPEMDGLKVARLVRADNPPSLAFVTAYDEFAIEAFELNAIDYLLKPVDRARLVETVERVKIVRRLPPADLGKQLADAGSALQAIGKRPYLDRIPVRRRDEALIIPVRQLVSIVAERELLHLPTLASERFTIAYRLHALEARLDPRRFVRISRGAVVAIDAIQKLNAMPGGAFEVKLVNGDTLAASRQQSRILRDTLLRL